MRSWLILTFLPGVYTALINERARSAELRAEVERERTLAKEREASLQARIDQLETAAAKERQELLNRFVGPMPGEVADNGMRRRVGLPHPVSPLQRSLAAAFKAYQAKAEQPIIVGPETDGVQMGGAAATEAEVVDDYLREQATQGAQ